MNLDFQSNEQTELKSLYFMHLRKMRRSLQTTDAILILMKTISWNILLVWNVDLHWFKNFDSLQFSLKIQKKSLYAFFFRWMSNFASFCCNTICLLFLIARRWILAALVPFVQAKIIAKINMKIVVGFILKFLLWKLLLYFQLMWYLSNNAPFIAVNQGSAPSKSGAMSSRVFIKQ